MQFQVQGKVTIREADAKQQCLARSRDTEAEGRVCASHILFATKPGLSADEEREIFGRAAQMQAELSSGGDFDAYAMRFSDDKGAPDGKLGCFGRGEMVEAFEEAAFDMQVGQISPVVKTPFGFHIIKVYDRVAAAGVSCDDPAVLEQYQNELYQQEMEKQMNIWVQELRRRAFVEVRL